MVRNIQKTYYGQARGYSPTAVCGRLGHGATKFCLNFIKHLPWIRPPGNGNQLTIVALVTTLILNSEVEKSFLVLVLVVVLENSDISPSQKRNKIIARKIGSFLGA
jgi:hypothetical protein